MYREFKNKLFHNYWKRTEKHEKRTQSCARCSFAIFATITKNLGNFPARLHLDSPKTNLTETNSVSMYAHAWLLRYQKSATLFYPIASRLTQDERHRSKFPFRCMLIHGYCICSRQRRVSDQRLAEIETLMGLENVRGKVVTVPVAFGVLDPDKM